MRCQLTPAEGPNGRQLRLAQFGVPVLSVWDAFSMLLTSLFGRKPCRSQQQTAMPPPPPPPLMSDETLSCVAQLRTWLNVMETFFSGDKRSASISKARVAFLRVFSHTLTRTSTLRLVFAPLPARDAHHA
jgi:hypothetical protein